MTTKTRASDELFTRREGEVEHAVLAVDELYTVTFEGRQICLRTNSPHRELNQYKLCLYTNPNVAAKKMRRLNQEYNTDGFRVDRIDGIGEPVRRDREVEDRSYNRTLFVKGEQGWRVVEE